MRILVFCNHCGELFNKIPSQIRGSSFCSRECVVESKVHLREVLPCDNCGKEMSRLKSHPTESNYCSRKCAGEGHSKRMEGSGHPNWKGGYDTRKSPEYKAWRLDVYERDSFTCQKCGQVGGELNAHHVLGWARFESARFKLSNGVTLCKKCHNVFHNTYTRTRFTEEDYVEFMV